MHKNLVFLGVIKIFDFYRMPRSPNGMEQSLDLWPEKASGFDTCGRNSRPRRISKEKFKYPAEILIFEVG